jgi:predicted RNase H-like HicB family nuclease
MVAAFWPMYNQRAAVTSRSDTSDWNLLMQFTAVYMQVPEGYIAFLEELPGANTQGATLEEAKENLKEAAAMVLEANRQLAEQSIAGKAVTKEPFVPSAS